MTPNERLRLLAEHNLSRIYITRVGDVMIAVTRTDQGYQARIIGKTGTVLARGCGSEEAALLAAAVALEIG